MASENQDNIRYLKWWVLNFANSADSEGYVSGCITTDGPRPIFGKFAMKPFLAQGAYLASEWSGDFSWIWNTDQMLTPYGLRSLSKQDSSYNNQAIIIPYSNWQGPVWMVANYMYFIGLRKYGFDKADVSQRSFIYNFFLPLNP